MPDPIPAKVRAAKQRAFLKAYAKTGTITHAAKRAGITRFAHHSWLRQAKRGKCGGYLDRWEDAQERYKERIEREIDRRAIDGVLEPVHYQGKRVDKVRKYSDNLLMFRAKAEMPEKYRDQYTVRHEGEININALDAAIEQARQLKVINLEPQLIEAGEGEENANG